MAESIPVGGQPHTLEQEIALIEQDLASKRAALEQQQNSGQITELPQEKETLHEVIGERIGTSQPGDSTSSPQVSSGQAATGVPPPLVQSPSYLSPELKEKVQDLVNIAFAQTIESATKQAVATNNAALIDAFHDALVDELYNYLIERRKITKL